MVVRDIISQQREEMADRMNLLAEYPDIVERMGKAGRKRVLENYTWKIFLDRIEKQFEEVKNLKNG